MINLYNNYCKFVFVKLPTTLYTMYIPCFVIVAHPKKSWEVLECQSLKVTMVKTNLMRDYDKKRKEWGERNLITFDLI